MQVVKTISLKTDVRKVVRHINVIFSIVSNIKRKTGFSSSQIKKLRKNVKKNKPVFKKNNLDIDKNLSYSKESKISFIIPTRSRVKSRPRSAARNFIDKKTGKNKIQTVTYTPEETKRHEEFIAVFSSKIMKDRKIKPFDGPVRVKAIFKFNPSDFTQKTLLVTSMCIGDIDNHTKSLQDGMNGVVFKDDSLIVSLNSEKVLVYNEPSSIFVEITGTYKNGKST